MKPIIVLQVLGLLSLFALAAFILYIYWAAIVVFATAMLILSMAKLAAGMTFCLISFIIVGMPKILDLSSRRCLGHLYRTILSNEDELQKQVESKCETVLTQNGLNLNDLSTQDQAKLKSAAEDDLKTNQNCNVGRFASAVLAGVIFFVVQPLQYFHLLSSLLATFILANIHVVAVLAIAVSICIVSALIITTITGNLGKIWGYLSVLLGFETSKKLDEFVLQLVKRNSQVVNGNVQDESNQQEECSRGRACTI